MLKIPNFIFLQRLVWSILCLQQHRSTLQALQAVPPTLLYIQNNSARHHIYGISENAILIIEVFLKMPTNANTRLRSSLMPVYWHHGAGF